MTVMEDPRRLHVGLANVLLARRLIASMVRVLEPDDVALGDVTEIWTAFDGDRTVGYEREDVARGAGRGRGFVAGGGRDPPPDSN